MNNAYEGQTPEEFEKWIATLKNIVLDARKRDVALQGELSEIEGMIHAAEVDGDRDMLKSIESRIQRLSK